jgi:hypothetical protein
MKQRIEIDIEGDTESYLETALDVVIRLVKQGFTSGHDSSDSGRFRFDVTTTDKPRPQK